MSVQRGIWAVTIAALVLGLAFRIVHIEHRTLWADESWTALRVSGHTYVELRRLFDGSVHSSADVARFQQVDPQRGVWATVEGLAREEPQHPPVFYALDHWWAVLFGSSIPSLRALAVIFSFAAIAAIAWFGFELTASVNVALAAAAIMAVSPFFVNYGAQAREYSLWAAFVSATSALLLRALRSNARAAWIAYALTAALSLYSALFMALVLAGHAAFVLLAHRRDRGRILRFFLAIGFAVLAFTPWLAACADAHRKVWAEQTWTRIPYPLMLFAEKWAFNAGSVLFDAEYRSLRLAPIAAALLALTIYCVVRVLRDEPRRTSWLLAAIALAVALPQVLLDAATDAHSSTESRYMLPLWLVLLMALAIVFGRAMSAPAPRARHRWFAAFCAVMAIAAASSAYNSTAVSWWDNDDGYPSTQMAQRIAQSGDQPLVVSEGHWAEVLVISHYLPTATRYLLFKHQVPFPLHATADTFVIAPSVQTVQAFDAEPAYMLDAIAIASPVSAPLQRFRAAAASRTVARPTSDPAFLYRVRSRMHAGRLGLRTPSRGGISP